MSLNITRTAIACLGLFGGVASAQSLTTLGEGIAQGISADGTTVVGGSQFIGAWHWTAGGGQHDLPGSTWAYGVSSDGSAVFGDGTGDHAGALWTVGPGWQGIGSLPGTSGACGYGSPYALSDGGDVAVGLGWDGCSAFAYKWTPGGGIEDLGQLGPFSSRANAVSGDGTLIGGWDEASNGTRRAALWFPGGTEMLILEQPGSNPLGAGEVAGLSSDGTWASGIDTQSGEAFRWSAATGVELLGSIPGYNGATGMAISDDGKTVVGFAGIAFFGITAIIWTEDAGMQPFAEFAFGLGLSIPAGQGFQVMHDMTADGDKIVGYYAVDAGPFSTRTPVLVRRTDEPTGAWTDLGGGTTGINGQPTLAVSGPLTVGSNLDIGLTQAPTNALMLLRLSLTSTPVNVVGGTLYTNPFDAQILLVADGAGEFSLTAPVAAGAPPGQDIYMQFIVQDLSSIFGITLSNAVTATTP